MINLTTLFMRCNNGKSGDIYGCPRTCTLYIAATTKWTVDRMGMLAHATTACLWFNYMYMYLNMNVYHGTLLERALQVTNRTAWSESIEEGGRTLASNMIQPHFATTFIHRTALVCIEKEPNYTWINSQAFYCTHNHCISSE